MRVASGGKCRCQRDGRRCGARTEVHDGDARNSTSRSCESRLAQLAPADTRLSGSPCQPQPWQFPHFPLPDWLILAAAPGILSHRYRAAKMGFRPLRPFRPSLRGGFPEFPQFPLPDWLILAAAPGILSHRYRGPKRGFRPLRPFRRSFGAHGRADGRLRASYSRRLAFALRLMRRRC
jgi:hypothetical protein